MPKPRPIANKRLSLLPASSIRRGARGPSGISPPGSPGPPGTSTFDLSIFAAGKPGSAEVLIYYVFVSSVLFSIDFDGSRGVAAIASTTSPEFSVQVNGVEIGTATFFIDDVADFSLVAPVTLNPGDVFALVAPVIPDDSLSDVSFTFKGSKP